MKGAASDLRAPVAAVVCALVVLTVPVTALRALFALPLCFLLPGLSLTEAMFGRRRPPGNQALMLALALSLATLVLGALVLTLTPWGLRAGPWAVLLVGVVLGGSAAARLRGGPVRPARRPSPRLGVRRLDAVLLLVAAVVAGSAFAVSRAPLPAPNALGYTVLSILPTDSAYGPRLRIEVRSQEQRRTSYRLQLSVGTTGGLTERITLMPGQQDLMSIPAPLVSSVPPVYLIAVLYKVGVRTPYRTATARLPISDSLIL